MNIFAEDKHWREMTFALLAAPDDESRERMLKECHVPQEVRRLRINFRLMRDRIDAGLATDEELDAIAKAKGTWRTRP